MISQKDLQKQQKEIYLLLHNIRSTHNVGSIFRTADATGVSKIYLSGYTPLPIDRFGRARQDISKDSLRAEKTVAWEAVENVFDFLKKIKKEKVNIIGLEQHEKSIDYKDLKVNGKALIVLGEEVEGIEKGILEFCDEIVEIPMFGKKESFNVVQAAAMALYHCRFAKL